MIFFSRWDIDDISYIHRDIIFCPTPIFNAIMLEKATALTEATVCGDILQ